MNQALRLGLLTGLAALAATGCGAPQQQVQATESRQQVAATNIIGDGVNSNDTVVSQQFRSLDEYLLHLERMEGPVDGPWYREIRPGVYQLQTGNLHLDESVPGNKTIFTREELERKFGFRK